MIKAKLNGEHEIILPKHRADRPEWYTEKGWEKKRLKSMKKNLDAMDTMFYVGAEEGEMAALCQIWGSRVIMFEPNPKAWSHIRSIWEANKLDFPLGIYPGFASDVTQQATKESELQHLLKIQEDGWPVSSQFEMEAAHGFKELDKESEYFDQVTIDDVIEVTRILPTAISLDVEGAEGKVLRGAETCLKVCRPKIWLSGHPEFLHDNYNGGGGFEYLRELRDWLKNDFGYKEDILDYDHEVHLFYHI